MKKSCIITIALSAFCLTEVANAGTIVPSLNDADAVFATNNSVANAPTPAMTLANGVTLAAQITPFAQDLASSSTGAVQVIEVGGTSRGAGLWIIDNSITFLTKNGVPNSYSPSLSDVDGSDNTLAYSFGTLTAGVSYDIWASFDSANSLLTLSLNNNITQVSLTGVNATWNWMGNGGIDFGGLEDVPGRLGGLCDNSASGVFFRSNSVPLIGTASEGQIFNEIAPVPEPTILALSAIGLLMLTFSFRLRRRQAG